VRVWFTLQRKLSGWGSTARGLSAEVGRANRRVEDRRAGRKALCLKLDRFVQGNRDALALVRVPTEEEEQLRAIHRRGEQLVKAAQTIRSPRDAVSWSITA